MHPALGINWDHVWQAGHRAWPPYGLHSDNALCHATCPRSPSCQVAEASPRLLWLKVGHFPHLHLTCSSERAQKGASHLSLPWPEASASPGQTHRPKGPSRHVSSHRLTRRLGGLQSLGGPWPPLHRMGLWDGEGQDLGALGHRPCADAVAGLGRVRVEVHLSGREAQGEPSQSWGKPTQKALPSLALSLRHSTNMPVIINATFCGALGWGSQRLDQGLHFILSLSLF